MEMVESESRTKHAIALTGYRREENAYQNCKRRGDIRINLIVRVGIETLVITWIVSVGNELEFLCELNAR